MGCTSIARSSGNPVVHTFTNKHSNLLMTFPRHTVNYNQVVLASDIVVGLLSGVVLDKMYAIALLHSELFAVFVTN